MKSGGRWKRSRCYALRGPLDRSRGEMKSCPPHLLPLSPPPPLMRAETRGEANTSSSTTEAPSKLSSASKSSYPTPSRTLLVTLVSSRTNFEGGTSEPLASRADFRGQGQTCARCISLCFKHRSIVRSVLQESETRVVGFVVRFLHFLDDGLVLRGVFLSDLPPCLPRSGAIYPLKAFGLDGFGFVVLSPL